MAVEGMDKYGSGQYGPGGELIDTDKPFKVWTEFLSKNDYNDLWGIRTWLIQEERYMSMEADCGDYMGALNILIEGEMGFIVSSWDNRDEGNGTNAEFSEC